MSTTTGKGERHGRLRWAAPLEITAGLCLVMSLAAATARGVDAPPPSAVAPLLKLFQGGRLPAERTDAVVEMICQRGNAQDLQIVVERVLGSDRYGRDLQKKTMNWLTDAALTRKVIPPGDRRSLEAFIVGPNSGQDSALQQAAIGLVSAWRDESIVSALVQLIQQDAAAPTANIPLQQSIVRGLVSIGNSECQAALRDLVKPGTARPIRLQATAGLTGFDLPAAASAAAAALSELDPHDDPTAVLDAFLQRKEGPELLGSALKTVPLSVDTAKRLLRSLYAVGRSDPALADVLSAAAGLAVDAPPPTPAEIAQIVADVMTHGDPVRGEAIFRRKDLNCMKCHSVSRAGGQVGPDLSAVGGSSPVEYIVNSILNPNLAVKEQFATRVFILSTGVSLTGVVIDRDQVRVNLRDAHGQTLTVPVADIEEELEGQSLMPQGLTKFLARQELLDLARFVAELGRPGPYAVQTAKTFQRWRVLRDVPVELTQGVPHLEHLRELVLNAPATAWDAAYARVAGVLPLDELRPENRQQVLILQAEIDVSTAGEITVQTTCDVPLQMWIDANTADTASAHTLTLGTGRHIVTVRVEGGADKPGELRVECTTPPGSTANFQVVGGP